MPAAFLACSSLAMTPSRTESRWADLSDSDNEIPIAPAPIEPALPARPIKETDPDSELSFPQRRVADESITQRSALRSAFGHTSGRERRPCTPYVVGSCNTENLLQDDNHEVPVFPRSPLDCGDFRNTREHNGHAPSQQNKDPSIKPMRKKLIQMGFHCKEVKAMQDSAVMAAYYGDKEKKAQNIAGGKKGNNP